MMRRTKHALAGLVLSLASLAPTNAMVIGRDERNDPGAFPDEDFFKKYNNEGRVECLVPNKSGEIYVATGWLTGGVDTIVTVSHAFYMLDNNVLKLNPKTCRFVTYDTIGNARDSIPIAYAKVYWDDPSRFGNFSYDLAVVKLTRAPRHSTRWPPIGDGRALVGRPVTLLAHHNDVPNNKVARVVHGRVFPMSSSKKGDFGKLFISDASRMFITDFDANHGASGGMVIDETGVAFGVHVGAISSGGTEHGDFNIDRSSFNIGVYIDREFFNLIRAVATDKNFTSPK